MFEIKNKCIKKTDYRNRSVQKITYWYFEIQVTIGDFLNEVSYTAPKWHNTTVVTVPIPGVVGHDFPVSEMNHGQAPVIFAKNWNQNFPFEAKFLDPLQEKEKSQNITEIHWSIFTFLMCIGTPRRINIYLGLCSISIDYWFLLKLALSLLPSENALAHQKHRTVQYSYKSPFDKRLPQ